MGELINAVMYELLFLIAVLLGYAFFGGINFVSSKILWGTLISLLIVIPIYINRALNIVNPTQAAFFSIMLLLLLVKKESAKKWGDPQKLDFFTRRLRSSRFHYAAKRWSLY